MLNVKILEPTFEARCLHSRFAERAYNLIVLTEEAEGEAIWGADADLEPVELEIPAASLMRLLTGWYGIDQADASYHERHADLLRVLFPKRDPKIGLADLI